MVPSPGGTVEKELVLFLEELRAWPLEHSLMNKNANHGGTGWEQRRCASGASRTAWSGSNILVSWRAGF